MKNSVNACNHSVILCIRLRNQKIENGSIVFQKKILGLADSELAKVAIFVEESPKYLS